jgi:hypothetical protein
VGYRSVSLVCLNETNLTDRREQAYPNKTGSKLSSLPPLQQESCNHCNNHRGSYPNMLPKHVEGGGSRHGVSEL